MANLKIVLVTDSGEMKLCADDLVRGCVRVFSSLRRNALFTFYFYSKKHFFVLSNKEEDGRTKKFDELDKK